MSRIMQKLQDLHFNYYTETIGIVTGVSTLGGGIYSTYQSVKNNDSLPYSALKSVGYALGADIMDLCILPYIQLLYHRL